MADKPPRESWDALQARRADAAAPAELPADTPEEMVYRVLTGGEGRDFLNFLREKYVERVLRPLAGDAEIREFSANHRLVKELEMMRDRGAEIRALRHKKAAT